MFAALLVLVALSVAYALYMHYREMSSSKDVLGKAVRGSINGILSVYDDYLKNVERRYGTKLLRCLEFADENVKDYSDIELRRVSFLQPCAGLELYVISPDGVIVASNYQPDVGLDLSKFYIWKEISNAVPGQMILERATVSKVEGLLKKYAYIKRSDGYFLEVGTTLNPDFNIIYGLRSLIMNYTGGMPYVKDMDVLLPNGSPLIGSYVPKRPDDAPVWMHYMWFDWQMNTSPFPYEDRLVPVVAEPFKIMVAMSFRSLQKHLVSAMFMILAMAVVAIYLSWYVSRLVAYDVSAPVEKLVAYVTRWEVGDKPGEEETEALKAVLESAPLEVAVLGSRIHDALESLHKSKLEIKEYSDRLEEAYKEIEDRADSLKQAYYFFARRMAELAEKYDYDTGRHIYRIGAMAGFLAAKLDMPNQFVEDIVRYAPLHDIGKIAVPRDILFKPGPLTPDEWEEMKRHTIYGWEILGGREPEKPMEMAANIARWHHEKWDGSGYPDGLSGHNIPVEARIVALVDVYDALRSRRPYKPAMTHQQALDIIIGGDGRVKPSHFDPEILAIFKAYHRKFDEIFRKDGELPW